MSGPEPDPVARWRHDSTPSSLPPIPLLFGLWGLAIAGSFLPAPWAPLLWWLLIPPFALLLRQGLHPDRAIDRPGLRLAALALGLVEAAGLLLALFLLGGLLGVLGVPGAVPLSLLAGLFAWALIGRRSAYRPIQALSAPIPGRDVYAAWSEWRHQLTPMPADRGTRIDHLALAAWLLLPWLLSLPAVVGHLPLAPLAYAALLFPSLALWLVDRAPPVASIAAVDPGLDSGRSSLGEIDAPVLTSASAEPGPDPDPVISPALQLIAAIRRGDLGTADHWLEVGADPDAEPPPGAPDPRSALQSAVAAGSVDLVQMLLRAGAGVDRVVQGRTALGEALRAGDRGHPEILTALLQAGADVELAESDGNRPLHLAARLTDPALARALLAAGALPDAVGIDGLTPLGVALQAGNTGLAEALLQAGAALEPPGGVPAVHAAVTMTADALDGLKLLQGVGADFGTVDGAGQTALMLAAAANHPNQVQWLVAAGCPVDAVDARGRSALLLAAAVGANRCLHALAGSGASATLVDGNGNSALHHAAGSASADLETLELLLGLEVPVRLRNAEGLSAEEVAYGQGRAGLARLLAPESDSDLASDDDSQSLSALSQLGTTTGSTLDRGDRLIQSCAQHRFEQALSLIRQGPLPQSVWVEALLAAGERLEPELLQALRAAGLRLDALAQPSPQLALARRLPCPAEALQRLIAAGASVEAEDDGDTVLALICGRAEDLAGATGGPAPPIGLLQAVLAARPPLELKDRDGHLPLHHAIHHRPLDWVIALLEAGADPNAPDRGGRTALHHGVAATRADRAELLRALILAGGDPAQPTFDGSTVQGLAAMAGESVLVGLCDFRSGEHPRHRLEPTEVPRVARAGQLRLLEKLLDLGLPVDGRDDRQATALIHAAGQGRVDMLELLLRRGADLALRSDHGADALAAAVLGGQQAAASLLLDRGAPVNGDYAGLTPVALAASRADPAMLQLLLLRGGSVNAASAERSPLALAMRAAMRQPDPVAAFACIDALLARRAAVEVRDAGGRNLLLWVCGSGENAPPVEDGPVLLALAGRLLAAGAEVNAVDAFQRNAAHWACRHHLPQLFALLLQYGVDTLKPDDMRRLPIDLVGVRRRHEFLDLLAQASAG